MASTRKVGGASAAMTAFTLREPRKSRRRDRRVSNHRADRHIGCRVAAPASRTSSLLVAFDMQRDEAAHRAMRGSVSVRRGSPALAACIGRHQRGCWRVEQPVGNRRHRGRTTRCGRRRPCRARRHRAARPSRQGLRGQLSAVLDGRLSAGRARRNGPSAALSCSRLSVDQRGIRTGEVSARSARRPVSP